MSFRIERGQMIPIQNRKDNKIKQTEPLDFQQLLQESIKNSDFKSFLTANYILRSVKKKNGKWALTYRVKDGSAKRIFYLDVEPDGSAYLTQTAGILYGFIMPSK